MTQNDGGYYQFGDIKIPKDSVNMPVKLVIGCVVLMLLLACCGLIAFVVIAAGGQRDGSAMATAQWMDYGTPTSIATLTLSEETPIAPSATPPPPPTVVPLLPSGTFNAQFLGGSDQIVFLFAETDGLQVPSERRYGLDWLTAELKKIGLLSEGETLVSEGPITARSIQIHTNGECVDYLKVNDSVWRRSRPNEKWWLGTDNIWIAK